MHGELAEQGARFVMLVAQFIDASNLNCDKQPGQGRAIIEEP
jgi:hypothetical protein